MPYTVLPDNAQIDMSAGGYASLPGNAQLDEPQMSGWERAVALPASNFAKGLASFADLIGKPFADAALSQAKAASGAASLVMGQDPMAKIGDASPVGVQTATREAGVTDRPDLVPQDTIEKIEAAAAQGAGEAVPTAAFVGGAIPALIAGASGGAAGEAGAEAYPNHPVAARVIGNLAGGSAAAAGGAITKALVSPFAQAAARSISPGAATSQAADRIATAMQQDIDSGAVTANDFSQAAATGLQPWELENAENTRALAGAITRAGGPARTTMRSYAKAEDKAAPQRLDAALSNALGSGDINATINNIQTAQKATATPLYQQAFDGGSIAPLQDQLRASLIQATGAKGQIAKQIAQIEQNNPGALAARGAAGANVRATYMDLQRQLAQAENDRQATLAMFQRAQSDATANAPGAVWSPRIQQFLDDPIMKTGLQKGLQIQRLESVAAGTPFNPSEYAITGTNPDGSAIVGNVPNMRLLDAGKHGLDAIIGENQDPVTGRFNELGRAVTQFKQAYLSELDGLNPVYAQARAAWSGPAQSLNAIRDGARVFKKTPAQITSDLSDLSPSDQALYRLSGVQQAVSPSMNVGTLGTNEAARLLGNTPDNLKPQLDALLPDQASRDSVLAAAQRANLKKQAMGAISGNSATVERAMDQLAHGGGDGGIFGKAAVAAGSFAGHEPWLGASYTVRLLNDLFKKQMSVSPALNARMAQMLTDRSGASLAPALAKLPQAAPISPYWYAIPAPAAASLLQKPNAPFGLAP